MRESCNTFILKIPSSFNQFTKQDIIGFFHLLLAWHFQWLEPDIWAKGLKLPPVKPGEALALVGRRLLTSPHFLRSGNLHLTSVCSRILPSVCQDSSVEFKYSVPTPAALATARRDAKTSCHLFQSWAFSHIWVSPLLGATTAWKNHWTKDVQIWVFRCGNDFT